MSYSSKKRQKKLSMLVGMALGAGIVFGMLPTDAAEAATWDITKNNGGKYEFKCDGVAYGEPLIYDEFKENMLKELEIKRRERVQNLESGTEASAEE